MRRIYTYSHRSYIMEDRHIVYDLPEDVTEEILVRPDNKPLHSEHDDFPDFKLFEELAEIIVSERSD